MDAPHASRNIRRPLGLERERALRRSGYRVIAGLDEVGRGPLAGPVVAAAVVLDPERVPAGLADSKALSRAQRGALFERILASAHVGVASVPHDEIDAVNIRQATLAAMSRAHREILHLARLLQRLSDGLKVEDADRYLIRDAQRVIESIESLVRMHNAQEEDIYEHATTG